MKATIIGGGIAGLTAAIALRRVGIDARVFERAPEPREIGAGIGLGANAIKALRRLGLDAPILAAGDAWRTVQLRTAAGRGLMTEDFGQHQAALGAPAVVLHRAELLEILLSALPAGVVRFGQES